MEVTNEKLHMVAMLLLAWPPQATALTGVQ